MDYEVRARFLDIFGVIKLIKYLEKTLLSDYEKDGCRMFHIDICIKSLKLYWIRRLLNSNSEWSMLFNEVMNCNTAHLTHLGSQYSKQKANSTSNLSCKETLFSLYWILGLYRAKMWTWTYYNHCGLPRRAMCKIIVYFTSLCMKRVFIFHMICWISW